MHLKSLSIYGFKTFANKMDFQFRPGVTAIIGPNGSGKSNVIDSIIWVMGEQSVRSIRGRKMIEVIYHGGENKKPLGYAQVVITFDNEDGSFPLPHSEVSIMRRYYKSGDSEFAINREPCRLKDIHALLRDSGLGKMNYSVISQGDVEYIIDLSPTQRREIFDEAAGINSYKIEKQKTLQKIKETDQNIARLRDILAEIEESLEPLKIQAEKAQRFEELTEQIEKLKLSVTVSDIVRLLDRLKMLREEDKQIRENNAAAVITIKETEQRIKELSRESEASRLKIEEKMEALASVGGEVGRAEESIRRLSASMTQAAQNITSMENTKKDATQKLNRLALELEESRKQLTEKKNQLQALREQATGASHDGGGNLREREETLNNECSDLRNKIQNLSADETRLKNEIDFLRRRIASVDGQTADLNKERHRLRSRAEELRLKLESLAAKEKERSEELEQLRSEEKKLDEQIPGAAKKLDEDKERFNRMSDEVRELKTRINALEKVAVSVTELYSKAEADSKDSGAGSGIDVKPEMFTAVRRALGDAMKAAPAPADLSTNLPGDSGAASFYLVKKWFDANPTPDLSAVKSATGVLGTLDAFVQIDNSADETLTVIFKKILVIDSVKNLAEIAGKIPPGAAAVTRDGEALFKNGLLVVGEDLVTPEAVSERLSQAKLDIEDRSSKLEHYKARLSESEKTFGNLGRRQGEVHGRIMKLEAEESAASDRKNTFTDQLEMFSSELRRVEETLAETMPKKDEFVENMQKLEKELAGVLEEKQKLQASLNEKQPELHRLVESRKSREAERARLRGETDRLRGEIEQLQNKINTSNMERTRLSDRNAGLEESIEGLQRQMSRLETDVDAGRAELAEWTAKRKLLHQETDALRTERNRISQSIDKKTEEVEEKREELSTGKENLQGIEIKYARTETQLGEVRSRFIEEFPGMSEETAIETAPPVAPGEKGLFKSLRTERESLMPVNHLAIGEYEEKKTRHDSLLEQIGDLEDARSTLLDMVDKYDDKCRTEFMETFTIVQDKFTETFVEIFRGGDARLDLVGSEDPLEAGVEIKVQVPGQRMRNIGLLSGGQKALCAMTLIFSLLKVKPSPFYLLDEVDAGLDEVNVRRFREMLQKYSEDNQFLVITHNKGTLEGADYFYGITLDKKEGFSKFLSVSLEDTKNVSEA